MIDWEKYKDRLGKQPDGALAKELGVSTTRVQIVRARYGIEAWQPHLQMNKPNRVLVTLKNGRCKWIKERGDE